MKANKEEKNLNWLEEFHKGQKIQRMVASDIQNIASNLEYTSPHIAEELRYCYEKLQESEKLISSGLNRNMDEQLKSSQDFIGSALIGMLKSCKP